MVTGVVIGASLVVKGAKVVTGVVVGASLVVEGAEVVIGVVSLELSAESASVFG